MTEPHQNHLVGIAPWDPLSVDSENFSWMADAQRREINNILKSYTGYYDVFSELIQNALDALERRWEEDQGSFNPGLWIRINLKDNSISVTDNGCAMSFDQFQAFLRPNFSFKDGVRTRGSKGVGISYLAYGFNYLEVATKIGDRTFAGLLKNGRRWVDNGTETKPKVEPSQAAHEVFYELDRGTSVTLKLTGDEVRPKNLGYFGGQTSKQWLTILRAKTPLGAIYLLENARTLDVALELEVIDTDGVASIERVENPDYLYPHTIFSKVIDVGEFIEWSTKTNKAGRDPSKIPMRFRGLNGVMGIWQGNAILSDGSVFEGMQLDNEELRMIDDLNVGVYAFFGYSTDLWDEFNDIKQGLRRGSRIIEGGLQLATKHMPQGTTRTIPLTENIGYQNNAHVIVHLEADPDLGRKGFQPEHEKLAEKLSVRAVSQLSRRFSRLLRKKTGESTILDEMVLDQWIEQQKAHARESPLLLKGKGLFMPAETLPILSTPVVEQDVVALFNQMLSAGIVRGMRLLSSSQYKQYDGLYQIVLDSDISKYVISSENPLGVEREQFRNINISIPGPVRILEYKLDMRGLFEEFTTGEKNADEIGLVVAWSLSGNWKRDFQITSYLDPETRHHRPLHGYTHSFTHSTSGLRAFEAIILEDLVNYLVDQIREETRQHKLYADDD